MTLTTPFPMPAGLVSNGKRRGHVRVGLSYSPTFNGSMGSEYCQTNVSAHFGRLFVNRTTGETRFQGELPQIPEHTGQNARLERELIETGWKWSPTKLYEKTFHRLHVADNEHQWQLTTKLLLRRELEPDRDQIRQPFWVGIRVSDPLRTTDVYQDMRQQLSAIGLATPIPTAVRVPATGI